MPTTYQRIVSYCRENNKLLFPPNQRKEIGKLIVEKWFADGGGTSGTYIPKVFSSEQEGGYKVLTYPREFAPQMDAIISQYYLENKLPLNAIPIPELPAPTQKKEAPKIIKQRQRTPVYSARLNPNRNK